METAIKCLPDIIDIIDAVTRDRFTASSKSPFYMYHRIWCSACVTRLSRDIFTIG